MTAFEGLSRSRTRRRNRDCPTCPASGTSGGAVGGEPLLWPQAPTGGAFGRGSEPGRLSVLHALHPQGGTGRGPAPSPSLRLQSDLPTGPIHPVQPDQRHHRQAHALAGYAGKLAMDARQLGPASLRRRASPLGTASSSRFPSGPFWGFGPPSKRPPSGVVFAFPVAG